MLTSRLNGKFQTRIPRSVCKALSLKEGDGLVYQIDCGRVVLRKAHQNDVGGDPFRSYKEWGSRADREAYAKLGEQNGARGRISSAATTKRRPGYR
jgi:bifunctional DNA-binding transcriptional regulator/antitoxin component of YhaV-PrlF toxin-antitoxin module